MNFEEIKNAMADLEEDALKEAIDAVAAEGSESAQLAVTAMQEGMQEIGSRFENGEYFVGDLIYAGEIMMDAMTTIKPLLGGKASASVGKVVLCTVKDDLHDIGKNIVKAMMEASGIDVVDLGVDVPAEKILETVKAEGIKVVALSGVLTLSLGSMKAVSDAFADAGIRDQVKIIIGGAPVTEEACQAAGADAWAHSPQRTVETCLGWLNA